jgi:transcriptional regulator with GAF, ATPase, and Fis domain
MPAELQVKLLRALQEKEIERLGGKATINVNVRIVAATNRDLEKEMHEGRFRSDLYYRLNIFPIELPPLRERRDDIPILAAHFIRRHAKKTGKSIVIRHCRGRISGPGGAAEILGVPASTLNSKMKRLGIKKEHIGVGRHSK